ncbi:MAG: hypothetical protein A2W35_06550 [Chloroflexi bacterium RBG_16_57_11]|nr:MAG: hypothetical protein A2W35_06550 [Chloroflexi bacterium RBG_16_57_11]HKZ02395.1 hypothetical protein [Pyrinomonadaceae bacterium]
MKHNYKMKDLGYPRTPTDKVLAVDMPDGFTWLIPLQLIADSRDEYWRDTRKDTIGEMYGGCVCAAISWADSNIEWSDIRDYATKSVPYRVADFDEGWRVGKKEIVDV